LFNKTIMLELYGQVAKWNRKASRLAMANGILVKYNTFFKEHTLLKLDPII
jgi:hypothetical protein